MANGLLDTFNNLGLSSKLGLLATGVDLLEGRPLGEAVKTGIGTYGGLSSIQQQQKQREGIAQLEKQFANNPKMLALLRSNPQGFMSAYTSSLLTPKVPSGFQSLHQRALAAGLDPNSKEYRDFMLTGGKSSTSSTFNALEQRAEAAGLIKGTPAYKKFMLTGGSQTSLSAEEVWLAQTHPRLFNQLMESRFGGANNQETGQGNVGGDANQGQNQDEAVVTEPNLNQGESTSEVGGEKEIDFIRPTEGRPDFETVYYKDGTKEVRSIQGSKAYTDEIKLRGKAQLQFKNITDRFDLINSQINEAIEIINKQTAVSPVTGALGLARSKLKGTDAYKLKTILDSLTAKLGFQELKGLKMEGSTLGQVTEQEFKNLSTAIVALEQGLKSEDLLGNFEQLKGVLQKSTNAIQQSILLEHPKLADKLNVTTSGSQEGKIDLPNPTTITRDELAAIIGDDFSGLDKLTDNDLRIIQARILTGRLN